MRSLKEERESDSFVDCTGSSAKADSLADACRDLDPCVNLPALLVAVSVGALADSGFFPSLRLLDPGLVQQRFLHPYQHHHRYVASA
nr:hypothetical protein [Tanacetum cinerariifolium]